MSVAPELRRRLRRKRHEADRGVCRDANGWLLVAGAPRPADEHPQNRPARALVGAIEVAR
jgi:hypothetical protein